MTYNANYPLSLDSLTNPTTTTNRNDVGFELHGVIGRLQDIVEALEAKVGIGTGGPPASAGVLRRTATGSSGWGLVQTADLDPTAVHQEWSVAGGVPTTDANQVTAGSYYDLPGSSIVLTGLTVGSLLIVSYGMSIQHSAVNGRNAMRVIRTDTSAPIGRNGPWIGGPAATPVLHGSTQYLVTNVTGLTLQMQAYQVDTGSSHIDALNGYLTAFELRP